MIPAAIKRAWWYCTDANWRKAYLASLRRTNTLRESQRRSYQLIWRQSNGCVVAGPFAGLCYLRDDASGSYPQKLLGTYEKELWPVMEEAISRNYRHVVDIGAAEGFYVCGLAQRMPKCRVKAFEGQRSYHPRITEMAQRNHVSDRVDLFGMCGASDLKSAIVGPGRLLVICDVEGAEYDLLDPEAIPELSKADILVEVHEHLHPGVSDTLRQRFQRSHEIQVIASVPRTLDDLPEGIVLDDELALAAMEESRGVDMEWFWMTSRTRESG